ncbi:cytochrome c oxidase assembly factor Coa1 family protein [Granulicella tundricola]|uniref:Uncharacterized protein n=1 Tax=Granulicella tundricola (strain ATCC BAA-1859 / DSM 23138 / MP5ACTX9) TaxID=1198114 RepID=E8X7H6_GRATM|nr:cytochrome c oxidase assembly factor Coa1 family protein [Granulicella tundricola]ADW71410.1 hypothetical protein AciX9_4464 [Granulicella tundricola MP5ACTX9]
MKWLVLTAIALVFLVTAISIPVIRNNKRSDLRVEQLRSNAELAMENSHLAHALLGENLRTVGSASINLHEQGDSGTAQLNLPVSGTRNKGLLNVEANESGGVWKIENLDIRVDGNSAWSSLLRPAP